MDGFWIFANLHPIAAVFITLFTVAAAVCLFFIFAAFCN